MITITNTQIGFKLLKQNDFSFTKHWTFDLGEGVDVEKEAPVVSEPIL